MEAARRQYKNLLAHRLDGLGCYVKIVSRLFAAAYFGGKNKKGARFIQ